MKQIIKDERIEYNTINIRVTTPTLDYLVKNSTRSFRVCRVSPESFTKLQKTDGIMDISEKEIIAGYAPLSQKVDFRSNGGLKIADKNIRGSFVIDQKKIIYDPLVRFYEERDSYVYSSGRDYYTTMSARDLLLEELKRKRQLLVYVGSKIVKYNSYPQFEEVSKEEMLEYITIPQKGEEAFQKLRRI